MSEWMDVNAINDSILPRAYDSTGRATLATRNHQVAKNIRLRVRVHSTIQARSEFLPAFLGDCA